MCLCYLILCHERDPWKRSCVHSRRTCLLPWIVLYYVLLKEWVALCDLGVKMIFLKVLPYTVLVTLFQAFRNVRRKILQLLYMHILPWRTTFSSRIHTTMRSTMSVSRKTQIKKKKLNGIIYQHYWLLLLAAANLLGLSRWPRWDCGNFWSILYYLYFFSGSLSKPFPIPTECLDLHTN